MTANSGCCVTRIGRSPFMKTENFKGAHFRQRRQNLLTRPGGSFTDIDLIEEQFARLPGYDCGIRCAGMQGS
jgi:hypothetical protein